VFEYSSLDRVPLIVEADTKMCAAGRLAAASIVFWTDRDPARNEVFGAIGDRVVSFAIPPSPAPSVVYYYLRTRWSTANGAASADTPIAGDAAPFVYFISTNHLGDLDAHDDVVDIFDLIRAVRHRAWGEPAGAADVEAIADALTRRFDPGRSKPAVQSLVSDARSARLTFIDGSSIVVPRTWRGRITDVAFDGALATGALSSTVRRAIRSTGSTADAASPAACSGIEHVRVNDVFYRREPHMARRYVALAVDNIGRDPGGFALASLYRALRVFVVSGTADPQTAQQFRASRPVYAVATIVSATYVALFVAGAAAAWRRGAPVGLPLLLIAYVPATIAPMLTNMRYSVTVQPLIFIFIAYALTTRLHAAPRAAAEAPLHARS